MSSHLFLPASLAITVLLSSLAAATSPKPNPFAKLSGKELVQRLNDETGRLRAFYELLRRAVPDEDNGFESFQSTHYDPRIIVCPQERNVPPIYIVLYDQVYEPDVPLRSGYVIEKPEELFGAAPRRPDRELVEPVIEAFAANGKRITPFGGDNLLHGTFFDLNADGTIERAEVTNYGIKGIENAEVLWVATVKEKAQPLWAVLLNFGRREWTYRLIDQDADGIPEIEAGPRTADGLRPIAAWKWDRTQRKYLGPSGTAGDHFRVLDAAKIWKELQRLQATKLRFPEDHEAISDRVYARSESTPTPSTSPEAATSSDPYRYVSLKGAPDADIFRFMGRGKSDFDRELNLKRDRLPENFWASDSKAAALAFVDANRSGAHRAGFQIAVDDRDGAQPPAQAVLSFARASALCYSDTRWNYFLRVDPHESYLAYTESQSGGVVFYNAVHDQSAFDFRLCPLSYDDARKIAEVVWWLDRVRARELPNRNSSSTAVISSADGWARVILRSGDTTLIDHADTSWAGYLAERGDGNYDRATFVNLVDFLFLRALPERLENEWSKFEPKFPQDITEQEEHEPRYSEEEEKRLRELSVRFIDWWTPAQEKISTGIVAAAVDCAGMRGLNSVAEKLRNIASALPSPTPPLRTYDQVEAELHKLPYAFAEKDRRKRKLLEQKRAALEEEEELIVNRRITGDTDDLRRNVNLARRQIEAANNTEQLYSWATSHSAGNQWALQRLATIDRKRYVDALEFIMSRLHGASQRQFFDELVKADRARAVAVARKVPPDKKDNLSISAFLQLREAGPVPEETVRVATIIKILHDQKSEWEERSRAIEVLVPAEAPMRYSEQEIDKILIKLLEPGSNDDSKYIVGNACRALARRGRLDLFDRIATYFEQKTDGSGNEDMLAALAQLTRDDPTRLRPRFVEIIRRELARTNKSVPKTLWIVWAADLRELQPELELLATHGPDEYEDRKGGSYGGEVTPVTGRFHLARKILNVWQESDPTTRDRLLVAMALADPYYFLCTPISDPAVRLKNELDRSATELSAESKQQLSTFLARLETATPPPVADSADADTCHKISALARKALKL